MFSPFELFVGVRYIYARRGNHFIAFISLTAIVATALGVAVLLTIVSIMNGFEEELPGEVGGMSEMLMPHDLCHVIGGFNTDMKGEISVAGFEAAMSRTEAGYDVLLSVLLNFHLGIRFTYEAERGHLDPDDLMQGFARGAPVEVDILTDWDWWPHLGRDLRELREALRVNGVPEVRMPPPRST